MTKITPQKEDFSKWYLDVIKYADLADYSKVKGCMVIKPWGYAIWENIQKNLDKMIKEADIPNVYFPLFIPESFINREKAHIKGFAPECAVVTHGGGKELAEKLYIRPTSETIIYDSFSDWIKSYRDLPLKINQWANVVRWEMRTRPFLRTTEFLWQEGHTAHATKECADKEAERALKMYEDFDNKYLAMPVLTGMKSRKETFAGALYTLSTEALAKDGKAIQAGTSHNLGQGFAENFNIKFVDENSQEKLVWQTSWGVSTRLVGTLIVVHGDDQGLRLPPAISPLQIIGVPIWKNDDEKNAVLSKFEEVEKNLKNISYGGETLRFKVDKRDLVSPGFKFNEWELKGVPLRIEIGPRDLEKGQCVVARRDNKEKTIISLKDLADKISSLLKAVQEGLYNEANEYLKKHIIEVSDFEEFKKMIEKGGFLKTSWCENIKCEQKIQDETKATIRIVEKDFVKNTKCLYCGEKAKKTVLFAKAY